MKRMILTGVLAAALGWPAGLKAQEQGPLVEGDRVRVSSVESGITCTGNVVARDSEAVTVDCWEPSRREWQLTDFPLESIGALAVQRGTRSNAGKGALLGGLIGGGFGLMVGVAAAINDCDASAWNWNWGWDDCWLPGGAEMVPLSTATFGLIGAGAGALIGMLSRSERWVSVAPDRLRVGVLPTTDGIELTVELSH